MRSDDIRREYTRPRLPCHVEKLAAWKKGEPFLPIRVNISPAGGCNHRCRFCYVDYLKHPNITIDPDILVDVSEELAKLGIHQELFEGIGEPLLNASTIDAIARARVYGGLPSFYLVTNGVLLKERDCEVMGAIIGKEDCIRISAPEATPKLYSLTHGCRSEDWAKLMGNIRTLNEHRNGKGTLIITVYPTPDMVGELRKAVSMCIDLGADIAAIYPPILKKANEATQNYRQDLRELHKAELEGVEDMSTDSCAVLYNKHWFDVAEDKCMERSCAGIDFYTCIGPDANVYPCFRYWLNKDFSYGSLYENTFAEIWRSDRRRDVRRKVLEVGPDDMTYCRNCAHSYMNKYLHEIANPSIYCGGI